MRSNIIFLIIILSEIIPTSLKADVKSSKTNAYTIIAPSDGVSVSKANAYTIITPQDGVSVSKASAYTILTPLDGVSVAKAIAYVILSPPSVNQPSINIMTNSDKPLSNIYPIFKLSSTSQVEK